ncbi:MAG TPA: hypothetical protein VHP62_08520 [Usitatibacter sp.]|nr:hypothetical protein [Usitatibacter sp.]
MGLLPTTAASVALGFIGFMKAAFGLRFAPDFFFGAALFAAFFIGFFAAGRLAADFFDLPFLAAIDESSNLMVTLSSSHLASVGATARGCATENPLSTVFALEKRFSTGDVAPEQQRFHASSSLAASTSSFSMASRGSIPAASE